MINVTTEGKLGQLVKIDNSVLIQDLDIPV
jgi:hypothetical protein